MLAQLLDTGSHAIGLYRLSHWLERSLGRPGRWLAYLVYRVNLFLTGADIPPTVTIGRRFMLPHPAGVVIGRKAAIGDDVKLMSGVVLGSKAAHRCYDDLYPTLGDRVFIGANSVVLGPVVIGDETVIGAGVVVAESVPPGSVVRAPTPLVEPRERGVRDPADPLSSPTSTR